jgi:NADH pyrophosphatase NudC (nudix superfamily)
MKFCPQCKSDLISGFIDKTKRLYCSSSSCDYVCWDNPVPVVAGIVQRDNKIILVRSKGWPEGFYGLVAGFLEKGETPEDGIMREVKEELGLETKNFNFIGYYSFFEKNQLILAFHVKAKGEIELCKDELDGYKLISPEKLKPWEMGTGPAVRDWLSSRKSQE